MLFLILSIINFLFIKNEILSFVLALIIFISCIMIKKYNENSKTLLATQIISGISIAIPIVVYSYLLLTVQDITSNTGKFQIFLIKEKGYNCSKNVCTKEYELADFISLVDEFDFSNNYYVEKIVTKDLLSKTDRVTNIEEYNYKEDIFKFNSFIGTKCEGVYNDNNGEFSCKCNGSDEDDTIKEYEDIECSNFKNIDIDNIKENFDNLLKETNINKLN